MFQNLNNYQNARKQHPDNAAVHGDENLAGAGKIATLEGGETSWVVEPGNQNQPPSSTNKRNHEEKYHHSLSPLNLIKTDNSTSRQTTTTTFHPTEDQSNHQGIINEDQTSHYLNNQWPEDGRESNTIKSNNATSNNTAPIYDDNRNKKNNNNIVDIHSEQESTNTTISPSLSSTSNEESTSGVSIGSTADYTLVSFRNKGRNLPEKISLTCHSSNTSGQGSLGEEMAIKGSIDDSESTSRSRENSSTNYFGEGGIIEPFQEEKTLKDTPHSTTNQSSSSLDRSEFALLNSLMKLGMGEENVPMDDGSSDLKGTKNASSLGAKVDEKSNLDTEYNNINMHQNRTNNRNRVVSGYESSASNSSSSSPFISSSLMPDGSHSTPLFSSNPSPLLHPTSGYSLNESGLNVSSPLFIPQGYSSMKKNIPNIKYLESQGGMGNSSSNTNLERNNSITSARRLSATSSLSMSSSNASTLGDSSIFSALNAQNAKDQASQNRTYNGGKPKFNSMSYNNSNSSLKTSMDSGNEDDARRNKHLLDLPSVPVPASVKLLELKQAGDLIKKENSTSSDGKHSRNQGGHGNRIPTNVVQQHLPQNHPNYTAKTGANHSSMLSSNHGEGPTKNMQPFVKYRNSDNNSGNNFAHGVNLSIREGGGGDFHVDSPDIVGGKDHLSRQYQQKIMPFNPLYNNHNMHHRSQPYHRNSPYGNKDRRNHHHSLTNSFIYDPQAAKRGNATLRKLCNDVSGQNQNGYFSSQNNRYNHHDHLSNGNIDDIFAYLEKMCFVDGVVPDLKTTKTIMRVCVQKVAWRRALQLLHMKNRGDGDGSTGGISLTNGLNCPDPAYPVHNVECISTYKNYGLNAQGGIAETSLKEEQDTITHEEQTSSTYNDIKRVASGENSDSNTSSHDDTERNSVSYLNVIKGATEKKSAREEIKSDEEIDNSNKDIYRNDKVNSSASIKMENSTASPDENSKENLLTKPNVESNPLGGILPRDVVIYTMAINTCGKAGEWQEGVNILREMKYPLPNYKFQKPGNEQGRWVIVHEDGVTTTATKDVNVHSKKASEPTNISSSDKQNGYLTASLQANEVTYGTAISACGKAGKWLNALELLEEMKAQGLELNDVCYGGAIDACGKAGQWLKAVELLQDMQTQVPYVKPNEVCYNSAISACGKAGEWEKAVSLLREMSINGLFPDELNYNSAISACGKAGQWNYAISLLREMKERGLAPDVVSYGAAIDACRKANNFEVALTLLHEMKSVGLQANEVCYHSAITACSESGKWEECLWVMKEMEDPQIGNLLPDSIAINATVDACGRGGQWQHIFQILRRTIMLFGPRNDCLNRNSSRSMGSSRGNASDEEDGYLSASGSNSLGQSSSGNNKNGIINILDNFCSHALTVTVKYANKNLELTSSILSLMEEYNLTPSYIALQYLEQAYASSMSHRSECTFPKDVTADEDIFNERKTSSNTESPMLNDMAKENTSESGENIDSVETAQAWKEILSQLERLKKDINGNSSDGPQSMSATFYSGNESKDGDGTPLHTATPVQSLGGHEMNNRYGHGNTSNLTYRGDFVSSQQNSYMNGRDRRSSVDSYLMSDNGMTNGNNHLSSSFYPGKNMPPHMENSKIITGMHHHQTETMPNGSQDTSNSPKFVPGQAYMTADLNHGNHFENTHNNNFYRHHQQQQHYEQSPYFGSARSSSSATSTPLYMSSASSHTQNTQPFNSNFHRASSQRQGNYGPQSLDNSPLFTGNRNSVGESVSFNGNGNAPQLHGGQSEASYMNSCNGNGTVLNVKASSFMLPPPASQQMASTSLNQVSNASIQRSLNSNSLEYASPYCRSTSPMSGYLHGNSVENTPLTSGHEWKDANASDNFHA